MARIVSHVSHDGAWEYHILHWVRLVAIQQDESYQPNVFGQLCTTGSRDSCEDASCRGRESDRNV
jgi:hypothetical protein